MTTRKSMVVAALCFAAGCADLDESTGTQGLEESSAERHGGATIRGTDFNRHRLTGGRVALKPVDLSTTPIEAQVERDGSFEVHPGAGRVDGTFEIEGVPHGRPYWLRVGTNYFLTRERVVDVGIDAIGRPDAIGAAAGTSLVFDVEGLAPVTGTDDFQLEAPDAQISFYSTASLLNAITANAPAPGDTALAGAVFPFDADAAAGTSQFPLIQASRGDTLTIAQLSPRQTGSLVYLALSRALTTSVEMTQGAATPVRGTMTAPRLFVTRADFRQAGFEALAEAIHPGSVPTGSTVTIDPAPAGQRVNLGAPDLALVALPAGSGDQVYPLEYRNPYPASWPVFAVTGSSFQVPVVGVDAEGSPTPRPITSNALAWEFVERGKVTVAPFLSPVRDLSIDGRPVSDRIRSAGPTPLVSWDRPRHGSPDAYLVRIFHVLPVAPFATRVARLVVEPDVRRVRVPSGVLQPGEPYYFQVIAVASSDPRSRHQLDIMFVPPRARLVDAFSSTIRVE